jgi:hypothetical protein
MRRVFFAYHYQNDVQRAQIVSKSWVTKPDRESAGFLNNLEFESKKRAGNELLKRFLTDAMAGSSVTCVLIGTETAFRPWVRYELVRSFQSGRGIFGVYVNSIAGWDSKPSLAGPNPLDRLAYKIMNGQVTWAEETNGQWRTYSEVAPGSMSELSYPIAGGEYAVFSKIFPTYQWHANNGYSNLGNWIETAARAAGR